MTWEVGVGPLFCCTRAGLYYPTRNWPAKTFQKATRIVVEVSRALQDLVRPIVEAMGLDLVRITFAGGDRQILQVMAEHPDGSMTVEDCTRLSRELSALLDVEDPISGNYQLEVSSPGIDRPLTRPKDFTRYAGFEAKIETSTAIDGRKRFRGRLGGLEDDVVNLEAPEGHVAIPINEILKAKLVLTSELIDAHQRS